MLLCRQAERRDDIKEVLQHWGYSRAIDMSPFETEGQYFEVGQGGTVLTVLLAALRLCKGYANAPLDSHQHAFR